MPVSIANAKNNYLRLMQLGESGSGKSRRAADATRWGKVYYFDFDGKIGNLVRSGFLTEEQSSLIEYDTYTSSQEAMRFAESLKTNNPYKTIVVDTSSVFNSIVETEVRQKCKLSPTAKFSYDEWGMVLGICTTFFYGLLLPLKCNLIVNSHIKVREQADGTELLDAAGAGSFAPTLKTRMTDSQYLYKKLGKYCVSVRASEKIAINSPVDPRFVDANGVLTVSDLSVFDPVKAGT